MKSPDPGVLMHHRPALVLILAASASWGCQPAASPPPTVAAVDTAAVVAAVTDFWAKWAVADTTESVDAVLALVTDNVQVDGLGFPSMQGKEAVKTTFDAVFKQMDYHEISANPTITTAVNNDLALQAGTFHERYTERGKKVEKTDHGRYAASLAKGADGQWRLSYIMSFVDSTTTKK